MCQRTIQPTAQPTPWLATIVCQRCRQSSTLRTHYREVLGFVSIFDIGNMAPLRIKRLQYLPKKFVVCLVFSPHSPINSQCTTFKLRQTTEVTWFMKDTLLACHAPSSLHLSPYAADDPYDQLPTAASALYKSPSSCC